MDSTLPVNYSLKGRYTISRSLGRGKMGAVYLAFDTLSQTQVAVKQSVTCKEEELRRQFLREAQLLYQLYHPGLPKVVDYFVELHNQYLVMNFVTGRSLRELLQSSTQPLAIDQVLNWADQLLAILEYLHGHADPVVHRDIKPQNIKVTETGHLFLVDFGIAKGNLPNVTSVLPGFTVLGFTEDYSPLEQILRSDESLRTAIIHLLTNEEKQLYLHSYTDPRSDLYSLSASLYHLLTGIKAPSSAKRFADLKHKHPDPLKRPCEVRTEIPEYISACIWRGMELDLRRRFSSATEMRQTLIWDDDSETVVRTSKRPAPFRAQLRWLNEDKIFPLEQDEIILGREVGQIRFSDLSVSGRHARILRGSDGFSITDENSRNGIYKLIVSEAELHDGDDILLADLQFKVVQKSPDSIELHHVITDNLTDFTYTFNAVETSIGTGPGMFRFAGLDDQDLGTPQALLKRGKVGFKLIDVNRTLSNYKRIKGTAPLLDADQLLIGTNLLQYEKAID